MKGPYDVLCEVDEDVHYLSRIYDMACRLPGFVRSVPLTAEQRDDMLRHVGNRTDMLLIPIHVVARLLDPKLRDSTVFSNIDLMAQFESVVERLIGKKGSTGFDECMDQLYHLQFGRGVLDTPQTKKQTAQDNAVLWWKAHGAGHPEIRELAIKDEDLGRDLANVIEAVDDYEPAVRDVGSAVGSTTVCRDPTGPSTSRSMQRLRNAEEVEEEEDNEEDDAEDEKEEEQPRGEEHQVEEQQPDEQQGREKQVEEEQGEEKGEEEQREQQVEEEGEEVKHVEEHKEGMQQGEEWQVEEHEKEHSLEEHLVKEHLVEEHLMAKHHVGEQQVGEQQVEKRGEGVQHLSEVRVFYGSSRQSPLVGQHGAHPDHVWDPLAYRAQRGRGRSISEHARGGAAQAARGTGRGMSASGRGRGRPRKEKQPVAAPATEESDDDFRESAPLHISKKRRT
ncbi:hypothetical protein CBR_g21105 [Chara braunii]|uniref:Uncharacterized protein n=1 Tax=Chara braunii TaxID=69332 RepID=A0A388L0M9_CHABU|nr:hypothetical protein CBR_g21105 [Chara braunii]|eukprot:GBG75860.1 hypothetical protein CBR_g21105 [Chara braunii]